MRCPRRDETLRDVGSEGEDSWDISDWKFTDPEEARKFNEEEARQQNEEAKAKGWNSITHPNPRYWLWPGPGDKPRRCSYCGGIHPEDALKLVRSHGFEVERSTKGYKVYLHPPGYHHTHRITINRLRKGLNPDVTEYEEIYPPLKAYAPHFTEEQWIALGSHNS